MRKIEALVENREVGEMREALRTIGVTTLRLSEATEEGGGPNRELTVARFAGPGGRNGIARVGLIVPDHLTDKVILTLLNFTRGAHDGSKPVPTSIERVVPLGPAAQLEDSN